MSFHPDSTAAGILAVTKALHAKNSGLPSEIFARLPRHLQHPAVEKAAVGPIDGNGLLPALNAVSLIEVERQRSFVAAAMDSFQKWPLYTRVVMNAVAVSGSIVTAGKPIPVKKMDLQGKILEPKKAGAIFAVSNELLEAIDTRTVNRLNQLMASACAKALDATVIDDVAAHAGTVSVPSTGNTPTAILADAKTALNAVNTLESSGKFYWIATPDIANLLATMEEDGQRSFPEVGPNGGEFLNLPFVVSNQGPEADSAGGKLMLVDAGRIAFALDSIEIQAGEHAALEMSDTPTDPDIASVTQVSMWQNNCVALRAILNFGFEIIGDEPLAAIIEGI